MAKPTMNPEIEWTKKKPIRKERTHTHTGSISFHVRCKDIPLPCVFIQFSLTLVAIYIDWIVNKKGLHIGFQPLQKEKKLFNFVRWLPFLQIGAQHKEVKLLSNDNLHDSEKIENFCPQNRAKQILKFTKMTQIQIESGYNA